MKFRVLLVGILSFLAITHSVNAQFSVTGGLELTPSTDNPVPGQTITITAKSYTIDINSSKITWVVDGKTVRSGTGVTSIDIIAPSLGKKSSIEATAVTTDGTTIKAVMAIGSGSVDLILETDGYTPPFFRGKLSPVYQNIVNIVAIPHIAGSSGTEYDPTTLIYQWKRNGRVIEDQSGYGKQSISLAGEIVPRPYEISVSVWSRDNSSSGQALINIGVIEPTIGFYLDDPLYGPLYNVAVGSVVRVGGNKEVSVLGVPFGFNKPSVGTGDLDIAWGLNGRGVGNLSGHESIVLRSPSGSSGTSNVQLTIRNTDKILQGSTGTFSAIFNAPTTNESASF